jgi:hypothetical protein
MGTRARQCRVKTIYHSDEGKETAEGSGIQREAGVRDNLNTSTRSTRKRDTDASLGEDPEGPGNIRETQSRIDPIQVIQKRPTLRRIPVNVQNGLDQYMSGTQQREYGNVSLRERPLPMRAQEERRHGASQAIREMRRPIIIGRGRRMAMCNQVCALLCSSSSFYRTLEPFFPEWPYAPHDSRLQLIELVA